jgi:hypothetical protein
MYERRAKLNGIIIYDNFCSFFFGRAMSEFSLISTLSREWLGDMRVYGDCFDSRSFIELANDGDFGVCW